MDIFFSLQNLSALKNADLRRPLICLAFNLRPDYDEPYFSPLLLTFLFPLG